jgi:hypothetical protein
MKNCQDSLTGLKFEARTIQIECSLTPLDCNIEYIKIIKWSLYYTWYISLEITTSMEQGEKHKNTNWKESPIVDTESQIGVSK